MKISHIEDVMYLVRMNLFFNDKEKGFIDLRDANVVSIVNDLVTLEKDGETYTYSLGGLEEICLKLNKEHWDSVSACLK